MSEVLRTYAEFLDYVNNKGVLAFSAGMPEPFPSLGSLTDQSQWHTGDSETDPWQWKDRAAREKKLAFGCILNGHKGFVSEKLYDQFYSAFRSSADLEERYDYGEVTREAMSVWELMRDGAEVSTFEIRTALNNIKSSKLDRALVSLQREYYITVSGSKRKISVKGEEYGWPSNTYAAVDSWAQGWLSGGLYDKAAAREAVVSHCLNVFPGLDGGRLRKVLFGGSL